MDRSIGLIQLTLFGLGTILGAGIYVLIGKVAAESGLYAPISFFIAALIASATAFSYAELSSRYPRSAGEAAFVFAAFSNRRLSTLTGWAIVLTGLVSAATLANGFVGYFQEFIGLPDTIIIIAVIVLMGLLAAWGIQQSITVAVTITLIEIIGLIIIIGVSGDHLMNLPERLPELRPDSSISSWTGIMAGSFLAFYAFIGFEDMVNVGEEVKRPSVTIPIAIGLAMLLATVLYVLVSITAVVSMPMEQLTASDAPFADLMQQQGYSPTLISLISLVAIINGALVQIIMASRVIYGMAEQGNAPAWMAEIHPLTRTPVKATMLATSMILMLALALPLVSLAKATSFIVLVVFAFVNLSLLRIKIIKPAEPNIYTCWPAVPILGAALSVGLLVFG